MFRSLFGPVIGAERAAIRQTKTRPGFREGGLLRSREALVVSVELCRKVGDRLLDQLSVGAGIDLFGDDALRGANGDIGRNRADIGKCLGFCLGDLVLGELRPAFNLRFQRASGQLENTARVRDVRRDIARVQTILGERRQAQ